MPKRATASASGNGRGWSWERDAGRCPFSNRELGVQDRVPYGVLWELKTVQYKSSLGHGIIETYPLEMYFLSRYSGLKSMCIGQIE